LNGGSPGNRITQVFAREVAPKPIERLGARGRGCNPGLLAAVEEHATPDKAKVAVVRPIVGASQDADKEHGRVILGLLHLESEARLSGFRHEGEARIARKRELHGVFERRGI
jgi:hypothetical protein